jgi:hypothetical protein
MFLTLGQSTALQTAFFGDVELRFTFTQNTGLYNQTGLSSPCPGGLDFRLAYDALFAINPQHWSFSPKWAFFTLSWEMDFVNTSPAPKTLVFFTNWSCFTLLWEMDFGGLHQPPGHR